MPTRSLVLTGALALAIAGPAAGQTLALGAPADTVPAPRPAAAPAEGADPANDAAEARTGLKRQVIQHLRLPDQRGLNVFEAPKDPGVAYNGFRLDWGAAFTQQFQAIDHANSANPRLVNGVDQNQLIRIGEGFNNATANLNLNAQLAPGIRVALTTYLSSRHHQETWVKDGYLQIDASPIRSPLLDEAFKYVTIRAGHFEINYGDAHFRRSDNGNAIYNPFVGNYILDAFTTEIGGEVYVRHAGFLAMVGATGGEIRGSVTQPQDRGVSWIGKLGYDAQVTPLVRLRLTGSMYHNGTAANNTLYGGDRAGSRYYSVLENTASSTNANFTSGALNPGFRNEVDAYMINPFVKVGDLELFGTYERASGKAAAEAEDRQVTQYAGDAVYRLLGDRLYVGARYNRVEGELSGIANDISINRWQLAGGWFITPNVLLKGEYVTQRYNDFPTTDIRSGGKFDGFMIEGVVAF